MNTYIWGTLEWDSYNEFARLFMKEHPLSLFAKGAPPKKIEELRKCLVGLLWSKQWTLPCLYCRRSFREFYRQIRPERAKAEDLPRLIFELHQLVNTKLGNETQDVDYERYRKRMLTWTSMIDPASLWDLLGILFLNYPQSQDEREPGSPNDPEAQQKREAYLEMLACLRALLRYIESLNTLANYIPLPSRADRPWRSRQEAYAAFLEHRDRWAKDYSPNLLRPLRVSHNICHHDCAPKIRAQRHSTQ